MSDPTNPPPAAQCETCGHAYPAQVQRCPKCMSNQRTLRPADAAHASKFAAPAARTADGANLA